MSARNLGVLVLLAAIWGSSYLFIRVAADPLGPVVVAMSRVTIAGIGLAAYALAVGKRSDLAAPDARFFWLGLGNAAIPYFLIAFGELHLTASMAGILNATAPLFAALVVAAWNRERIAPRTSAGLALGMLGVGVLVGWDPAPLTVSVGLAVGAMLLSSLSYAVSTVYARRVLRGMSSLRAALGQQVGAALLLAPFTVGSVATGSGDISPSLKVAVAMLALGLMCTSFAYLLYFHLIAEIGPLQTASVTFLIPIFGILWSALFLNEEVRPVMFVGLALILSSVTLVTGQRVPRLRGQRSGVREQEQGHVLTSDP